LSFNTHEELYSLTNSLKSSDKKSDSKYSSSYNNLHAKTLFKFSKLTDNLLRKIENSDGELETYIVEGLSKLDKKYNTEELARMTVHNGL